MSTGGGDAKLFARVRQQSIVPFTMEYLLLFDLLAYNAVLSTL